MIKVFHNEPMVRTRSYLLQDSCPNQPIIRTRSTFIAGFLSESAYHSDPFHIHCRIPVRISLPFGPVSHSLQDSCPNQPIIRTRFTFIAGFLSESAYHSNPFHIHCRIPVRISLPFGPVSHSLQDSCPNQPIIRTRFTFIAGFLSESASHSDPFHINYRKPVRISLSFGPVSHSLQDPCPNQPPIRTCFTFITGSLSESASHSDSISPWTHQTCLKKVLSGYDLA